MGECAHLDVSEDTRDENDCDENNTQVEIVIGRVRVIHLHSVPVFFLLLLLLFLCDYYECFGPQISTTTEHSFLFVVCNETKEVVLSQPSRPENLQDVMSATSQNCWNVMLGQPNRRFVMGGQTTTTKSGISSSNRTSVMKEQTTTQKREGQCATYAMKHKMPPIQSKEENPPKSCSINLIHSGFLGGGVSRFGPSFARRAAAVSDESPV
jgi:hypothetical protein